MLNKFCKMPLWECNRTLIRVAQGQEPAELVIRHARLISVTTHEILEDTDIAIACGRVAYVGIHTQQSIALARRPVSLTLRVLL